MKNYKNPIYVLAFYGIFMFFAFFAGNVFIDSYDTFIVRFLNPDADILLIFLVSLLLLLFLYAYFKQIFKTVFHLPSHCTVFLILTWVGLVGILIQNMLVPLNHIISYAELALTIFLLGALLLGRMSESDNRKFKKVDYQTFLICLVFVNTIFIFIKKIVFEQLGTKGLKLVAEIDLLGTTFNVTSLLLLVFAIILGIMIWNSVKNFQIIVNNINNRQKFEYSNKNFLGIILNQGIVLIVLLGSVFTSLYFMKNQNLLKDFMHYSFAANVNYYATMKWTYLTNLAFFLPFIALLFFVDLKNETTDKISNETKTTPIYNFNMSMVIDKKYFESVVHSYEKDELSKHEISKSPEIAKISAL